MLIAPPIRGVSGDILLQLSRRTLRQCARDTIHSPSSAKDNSNSRTMTDETLAGDFLLDRNDDRSGGT